MCGGVCVCVCVCWRGVGGVESSVSRLVICEKESMACLRTWNPVDSEGINWAKVSVREVNQGHTLQSLTEHVQDHKPWETSCILLSAFFFLKIPSVSQTTLTPYGLCLTNTQLSPFSLRQPWFCWGRWCVQLENLHFPAFLSDGDIQSWMLALTDTDVEKKNQSVY